ncbi:MAG TPA: alpha-ketoacid dehydrogenase subunit beta, partial [Erysipelotrichaceae bacterium]|nr:alpha-ketoacid dehydrogenase subunit beta [Erysipelotrichaceae bacterium]
LSEVGHLAKQLTIAVDDRFGEVGTTDYLMDKFGLTSRQIEEKILTLY